MHADRERWNRKHAGSSGGGRPSPLVERFFRLAPGSRALDLAAGTGRNAVFLAQQGFQVLALDIADRAVAALRGKSLPGIMPVLADLDSFPLPPNCFDLLINCRFLDRRLFPAMQECLAPGGVLLFESALETSLPSVSQPGNRDYLLRTNELLRVFQALRIVFYAETVGQDPLYPDKTVCLALLAAQKGAGDDEGLARVSAHASAFCSPLAQ